MVRIDDIVAEVLGAHVQTFKESTDSIRRAGEVMRQTLDAGGKILAFGNGGSAADAQHFAAELVNRYRIERRALAALALTTDSSILTSIANDSSYDRVFARQIEALGRAGDIALGISTSGRSPSVIAAFEQARSQQLATIALIGSDSSLVRELTDVCITVAASVTARVQEVHRTILHIMCELIES